VSRRRLLVGSGVAVTAVALLWTASPCILREAAGWLDVGRRPAPADYVMMLNGGEETRPFAAAALLKARFARRALVAEVVPSPAVAEDLVPPSHEINCEVLRRCGVPPADIVILPGQADSTYDEALALAAFLRDRPDARVLVVTNDYHTRRSRWIFARVLADRAGQATFVAAPSDEVPKDGWWRSPLGLAAIGAEYLKLAFYAARYGHLAEWLAACGALALVAWQVRRRERVSANGSPLPLGEG
jgi:uncharacterized SAM-binding protein YcdF (DUF218 family)